MSEGAPITVCPELVEGPLFLQASHMQLIPHLEAPALAITAIKAQCWHDAGRWHFRFLIDGATRLVLPDPAEPTRADTLWQATCFEAFVGCDGTAYREYNFAPSGQWAAYAFEGPRQGMLTADDQVEVWLEGGDDWIAVEAAVSAEFAPVSPLNLAAVIEEQGGHKSYWALAHAPCPPDFHNRDCFIAHLPPVQEP